VDALPDFPIGSPDTTLSQLPFDIMEYLCSTWLTMRDAASLLCLNRHLRVSLFELVHKFAEKTIKRRHPYYLPIKDAPCERGNEEWERWEKMWGSMERVPWVAYARACGWSPSMRNRKRIWGMAERFWEEVKLSGFLDRKSA
jgi:hypothetical protein